MYGEKGTRCHVATMELCALAALSTHCGGHTLCCQCATAAAIKNYLNKQLSDYINTVNSANSMVQQAVKGGGGLLLSEVKELLGQALAFKSSIGKGGIKDAVQEDLAKKVGWLLVAFN